MQDSSPLRATHDLGGVESPPFEIREHEPSDTDRRVDALVNLLAAPDVEIVRPDERRRGIEQLDPELYRTLSYYHRWLLGVTNILVEKNILSWCEIDDRVERLRAEATNSCRAP